MSSCQVGGVEGRWDASNVREVARPQTPAEVLDSERRGGAGAEADHTAGRHAGSGGPSDGAFQQLLRVGVVVVHGCFLCIYGGLPSAFRHS